MEYMNHPEKLFRHLLGAPFIYAMIVPLVFLDILLEIYHNICFPLYGLKRFKRSEYILIDRHKLKYLSWIQKINCAYCGYANGLAKYASAIAGETERYWCGIQHKKTPGFREPEHHKDFLKYGDEKAYNEKFN